MNMKKPHSLKKERGFNLEVLELVNEIDCSVSRFTTSFYYLIKPARLSKASGSGSFPRKRL